MIIDFRFTPPTPEGLFRYLTPPEHLRGYAEVYGSRVYGGSNQAIKPMQPPELIKYLDRVGVDKVLLKTSDNETTTGFKYPLDKLAEYIEGHESRLIGVAGVDPHKGIKAARELQQAIATLGFKAANITPCEHKLNANHKKYYPIYGKCVELDVPILIHTSINFSHELPLDFGHPRYIDEVAVDFPELKIVCVHGGWPWILEMISVAWRHNNVYIEVSGTRPKYIAMPGTGWEPLLVYGNSVVQDKVLWGSNWPQVSPEEGIAGVNSFPLKEDVKKKWLGLNAAHLLGIDISGPSTISIIPEKTS